MWEESKAGSLFLPLPSCWAVVLPCLCSLFCGHSWGQGALLGHSSHCSPDQQPLPWSFSPSHPLRCPHSLLVPPTPPAPSFSSLQWHLQLGPLFSARMLLNRHQVSSRLGGEKES